MPNLLRAGSSRGLAAVALGTALFAAACGGDATETSAGDESVTEPADGGSQEAADQSADDPEAGSADAGDQDSGDDTDSGDGADDGSDGQPADGDESAVEAENLFPDLEVIDIVDGSTVNLSQELFGGDTPVLLWFWAPH